MKRVVVAGGSVAGLFAARVLSSYADEVLILEPDDLDPNPHPRHGVPQGAHSHILLGRGQEITEALLPGFSQHLVSEGAELVEVEHDAGFFADGYRRAPIPGEPMLCMTRPFLEMHLRDRILGTPGIRVMRGRVAGLTATGDRVDGVEIALDGSPSTEHMAADLVIDATGRGSRLADWLKRIGYDAPTKQRVGVDIGYATCFFHRTPGQRLGGVAVAHSIRSTRTKHPGASSLNPVEGDLWMALTTGFAGDRPTRDMSEFLERCRSDPALPMRLVADECEPATDVATYRFPDSVRYDFHRMRRFPAGLLAIGDSVASFNPVYGQGMASAAMHADALDAWLRSSPRLDRPAYAYFRRVGRLVDAAWQTSAANDRLLPHVRTGPPNRRQKFRQRLAGMVAYASLVDVEVGKVFNDVVNMRVHPNRLRRPDMLLRAARVYRKRPRATPKPAPAPASREAASPAGKPIGG